MTASARWVRAARRGVWGIGLAVGIGLGAAACEPVGLDLVVDRGTDIPDAAPGDGVCATAVGTCTLRAAIDETNATPGLDRITISPTVGTVTLGRAGVGDDANFAGDLDIDDDLRLVGNGATVEQTTADRVLHVLDGDVRITNLVITGGERVGWPDSRGGGIAVSAGTVALGDLTVEGNEAAKGGGIAVLGGDVVLATSTVRDNTATANLVYDPNGDGAGGGVHVAAGTLALDRSVVTANTAAFGAGIGTRGGATALRYSTVSANVPITSVIGCLPPPNETTCAPTGISHGGTAIAAPAGSVTLTRSTVTGPGSSLVRGGGQVTAAGSVIASPSIGCDRPLVSGGHNLSSDASCLDAVEPTDLVAHAALLDVDHGTGLVVPHDNSPLVGAIPSGTADLCPWPVACTIGAADTTSGTALAPLALVVDTATDALDAAPGDGTCLAVGGGCTLRAAITEANARPTHDLVTIAGVNPTLTRAGQREDGNSTGDIDVVGHLTIDGGGAVLNGGLLDRVLNAVVGRTEVHDLEIRGGFAGSQGGGGGIVASASAVVLDGVTLDGNVGYQHTGGAALNVADSWLVVRNSTISGGSSNTLVRAARTTTTITASTLTDDAMAALDTFGSAARAAVTTVAGSILSSDTGQACYGAAIVSGGWNLDTDGTCLTVPATGDLPSAPALLEGLADNGGPTRTHLPFANSPAVDAIPAGTPGLCDVGAVDQRDVPRPEGAGCDIGAVEGDNGQPLAPLALVVDSSLDADDAVRGDGVCATAAATCTLRAAVSEANAWPTTDTITVAPGVDPTLSIPESGLTVNATGDLDIQGHLVIEGDGATLDAAGIHRAVEILSGDVTIGDLTIRGGGNVTSGAAILQRANTLTLERVTLTDNATTTYDQDRASAFHQDSGHTIVRNSTITANHGVAGAAVKIDGSAVIIGTTIVGNTRSNLGEYEATGLDAAYADVTMGSSIIDNAGRDCVVNDDLVSLGYNLAGDASCVDGSVAGDQSDVDVAILALADNGGPTPTMLPAANSPAVDAIPVGTVGLCDASTPTDQRLVARPAGAACDIGAVEGASTQSVLPLALVVDDASDASDAVPGDGACDTGAGVCTLRAAVQEANFTSVGDTITIAPGVDPTITIAGSNEDSALTGDLDLVNDVTIDGGGATVTGNGADRVFQVVAATDVLLTDLVVTGGSSPRGGGIVSDGDLTAIGITVTANQTTGACCNEGRGGGISAGGGTFHLEASTITANTSSFEGGGVYVAAYDATLVDNEVAGNTAGAGGGGGITVAAPGATITGGTVHDNTSVGSGGGIDAGYTGITVVGTTVADNSATSAGAVGGGIFVNGDNLVVDGATVTGNSAYSGGGIAGWWGSGTITRSTISANTANGGGGNAVRWGGSGSLTIRFATVIGGTGGAAILRPEGSTATVTVTASVLADAASCEGSIASGGWNWTADAACEFAAAGDTVGTDPLLGPLADNGGPTFTHLPDVGSPLIDAIPAGTAGVCDGTHPTDQRGQPRTAGQPCTVGAVEP